MTGLDGRLAAVRILAGVYAGRSLTAAGAEVLARLDDPRERAFAQDLSYGVLRWGPRLEGVADRLLRKPLPARDADVLCLVLVGLYQLIHTRVAPHAAVSETVSLSARLGKPWARGLVNAVLRRFQRESDALLALVDADDARALAHPPWLLERMKADWPHDWRAIAAAANTHPPMCLRVNQRRTQRDDYLHELGVAGIEGRLQPHTEAGIVLEHPVDVARLPGFAQGRVSVQDGSAQLAAALLDPRAGDRVLDLCAAPGGKTAHLLERQPGLETLVAVDIDPGRMRRVREGLTRLQLDATLVCADAARIPSWWNGAPFDRILLDAPCSASGVIRRHPDIKRLRRPADIDALAVRQAALLDAAWAVLAPGGMLLYATCSIIRQENDARIEAFLARQPDARERRIDAGWGRRLPFGRQILPGEDGMDGFFYACMDKPPAPDSSDR